MASFSEILKYYVKSLWFLLTHNLQSRKQYILQFLLDTVIKYRPKIYLHMYVLEVKYPVRIFW